MLEVACGQPLLWLIRLAYLAGTPLLLVGKHGIGKSAILAQAAVLLGIDHPGPQLDGAAGPGWSAHNRRRQNDLQFPGILAW